jgi:hypothetical protein
MIRYALDASFAYWRDNDDDPPLADWLDKMTAHLYELGVDGVFVTSQTSTSTFTVSMTIDALDGASIENVVGEGMVAIRTAAHACDARTQNWPTPSEAVPQVRITLLESSQRVLQPA